MKAAYVTETGDPGKILFGELPDPAPARGEVRVRVKAAVNPIDTYIRGGLVKMALLNPFIVGCDLTGVVNSVGVGVDGWQPGERVWGSNQGLLGRQGTFAELACAGAGWRHRTPDTIRDETAAAFALVGRSFEDGRTQTRSSPAAPTKQRGRR